MNRLENLLSIWMGPLQRFENACIQLISQTGPSTAFGAGVDLLGRIANITRQSLGDTDYLRNIRAQIAAYHSSGKREDLINVAKVMLFDVQGAYVKVYNEGTATAIVQVLNVVMPSQTTANFLSQFLQQAVAAGVRLVLRYSLSLPANTFTLDVGPGLDQGRLAGAISSY